MSYIPPGSEEISGRTYVRNARGGLEPIELVRPQDMIRDQLVRELFDAALGVNKALREFKTRAFTDIQGFLDLVDERYGAKARPGGDKGNVTLATIDGLVRLQIQVSDLIRFESAPLQACKKLLDECLAEWSADSNAELRQIVTNAFRVNAAGDINRGALLSLLRVDSKDPRWLRAMEALKDSIQVDSTKTYIRVHHRPTPDSVFVGVSLDAATA